MQARARGAAHESTLMRCSDIAPATLSDHEETYLLELDGQKLVYAERALIVSANHH